MHDHVLAAIAALYILRLVNPIRQGERGESDSAHGSEIPYLLKFRRFWGIEAS